MIIVGGARVAVASRLLRRTCEFSAPRKAETFYWSMPTIRRPRLISLSFATRSWTVGWVYQHQVGRLSAALYPP